jgi:hypothetical protein
MNLLQQKVVSLLLLLILLYVHVYTLYKLINIILLY